MEATEYIREQIRQAIPASFKNLTELAEKACVNQPNLTEFMRGKRKSMKLETAWKIWNVIAVAHDLGKFNPIFAGEISKFDSEAPSIRRPDALAPMETVAGEGLPTVPVYDIAGADPEFCTDSLEAVIRLPVLQRYYREGMYAVQIFGDSMEPIICNGAYVGVMPHDGELIEGAMYLIWRPYFGNMVKRVFIGRDGLILRSDNPKFEDIHLQYEGHDKVIIARVKWIWQEC
jgi:hypothetical protein